MAVLGTARLEGVDTCDPDTAWHEYHSTLSLTREEFNTYLDGAPAAHVLRLRHVQRLNEPLPLHDLRQQAPFRPPQSFRYVAESDPPTLQKLTTL